MGSSISKTRCDGFDILKCLAAFFIICIHAPFFGEFGKYVTAIARVGVPVFLMITGYFYSSTVKKNREAKQIKKVFFLMLGANILYFLYNLGMAVVKGAASEYLSECFSVKSILYFLLLNDSPFGSHLWYLGALLYTLLVVALLRKFVKQWERILYIVSPFLLVADLILGKYSLLIFGFEPVPYVLLRSFLFVGIPYFTLGLFISRHGEALSALKKRAALLYIASAVFAATTVLERFMLVSMGANATRDHYLSSTLMAFFLFLVFDDPVWNGRKLGLLKKIGREYSLLIYIIHSLTVPLIRGAFGKVGMLTIYGWLAPVIVFAVSIVISALYYFVKNKVKYKKT